MKAERLNRVIILFFAMVIVLMPVLSFAEVYEEYSDDDEEYYEDDEEYYENNPDPSKFPVMTRVEAVRTLKKAIKNHKMVVRFRIPEYIDNTASDDSEYDRMYWTIAGQGYYRPGIDPVYDLLHESYGRISDYYEFGSYFGHIGCYEYDPRENGFFEYEFSYILSKKKCDAFEKKLKKVRKSLKLKGLSKKKKALKIYKWITSNVKYDKICAEFDYGYGMSPYNALMKKKAVCQGIAGLYCRMLVDSGVEAKMIFGSSGGEGHSWVLVKIGKKWYNTDPTWDLGMSKQKYRWFLKTDKSFKRHKRDKDYKTKYFKKTHPMGRKNLKY